MKKIILAYMIIATAASAISVALKDTNHVTKLDTTKVTAKKHVSYSTPCWAILNVLADIYNTLLSKVGRDIIIYAIIHAIIHATKGVD